MGDDEITPESCEINPRITDTSWNITDITPIMMVRTCHNTRGAGYNITIIIMDNIPIMMVIKPINHVYICMYIIIINLYQLDAYLLGGTAYPSRG